MSTDLKSLKESQGKSKPSLQTHFSLIRDIVMIERAYHKEKITILERLFH